MGRDDVLIRLAFSLALLLLLGVFGTIAVLVTNATSASEHASIAITPVQVSVQQQMTLSAGTGIPDQTHVRARVIQASVSPQTTSVPTTGFHQQATRTAFGQISFHNIAPFDQYIQAGSLLTTKDGIQVETLAQASVPAANGEPLVVGITTVAARAVEGGASGNIAAHALYGTQCCDNKSVNGIVAYNDAPFSGGEDASQYAFVQQSDISSAQNVLTQQATALEHSTLAAQVHADEQLLAGSSTCTKTLQTNDHPGEKKSSISVTILDTCTGETYNVQDVQRLAKANFVEQEKGKLGASYQTTSFEEGSLHIKVVDAKNGTLEITVPVRGTFCYALDHAVFQHKLEQLAGKSPDQAKSLLLHLPGVAQVTISGNYSETLPSDIAHITITTDAPRSSAS